MQIRGAGMRGRAGRGGAKKAIVFLGGEEICGLGGLDLVYVEEC